MKTFVFSLANLYLRGMYFFTIVQIAPLLSRYRRLRRHTIPQFIVQLLTWPVSMPLICMHGNPLLQEAVLTDINQQVD